MQLLAVARGEDAHGVADRREFGAGDLDRRLRRVVEVEPRPELASRELARDDLERELQERAVAGLGGEHSALHDAALVGAGGKRVERGGRGDAARVEVQDGHVRVSLARSASPAGVAGGQAFWVWG